MPNVVEYHLGWGCSREKDWVESQAANSAKGQKKQETRSLTCKNAGEEGRQRRADQWESLDVSMREFSYRYTGSGRYRRKVEDTTYTWSCGVTLQEGMGYNLSAVKCSSMCTETCTCTSGTSFGFGHGCECSAPSDLKSKCAKSKAEWDVEIQRKLDFDLIQPLENLRNFAQ